MDNVLKETVAFMLFHNIPMVHEHWPLDCHMKCAYKVNFPFGKLVMVAASYIWVLLHMYVFCIYDFKDKYYETWHDIVIISIASFLIPKKEPNGTVKAARKL